MSFSRRLSDSRFFRRPVRPALRARSTPRFAAAETLEERRLLTTLLVDDDFSGLANGDVVDGGVFGTDRFAEIQTALDTAVIADIVQVRAGEYFESASILKDVTLEGIGNASGVIIDPGGADGITVSATAATIRNLTVRNASDGIRATAAGALSISDVVVSSLAGDGIDISGAGQVELTDVTANSNGGAGLKVLNAGNVILAGLNQAASNSSLGLDVVTAGDVSIETGLFSGMRITGAASISTGAATITSTSSIVLEAAGLVSLAGDLEAGANSVTVTANSDGVGDEDLVMTSGASIVTSSDLPEAITLSVNTLVGGVGRVELGQLRTGQNGGSVRVSASAGAVVDANSSLANVISTSAVLTGSNGVGRDVATIQPMDAIDTQVAVISGAGGIGGFFVTNDGPLMVGSGMGIMASVMTTGGDVQIESASPLTISSDVIGGGAVFLKANDSPFPGDDLRVETGVTVRASGGVVQLEAGDDLTLEAGSLVESLTTTVLLQGDSGNFDPGTGSTIQIDGVVNSAGGTTVTGQNDADEIRLTNAGTGGITLSGIAGDDRYVVSYPDLPKQFLSPVTIDDAGGGTDSATIEGTAGDDELFVTTAEPPTTIEEELVTRGNTTDEPIILTDSLEDVFIELGDGIDTAHVQPSNQFRISVDGGDPCYGDPGTPPGDTFEFQPLGSQFSIKDRTLTAYSATETYAGVSFSNFETLPIDQPGTGPVQLYDFNHTNTSSSVATSPNQPGYTSVRKDTLHADGLGFGWQESPHSFERNDGFYDGPQASLIQDGNSFGEMATFTADVPAPGYYLISMLVGSPYTDVDGVRIRNEDTQQILLDDITTLAGESSNVSVVFYTDDGTLDVTFIHSLGNPTLFGVNSMTIRPAELITMGLDTCGTDTLLADGVTIDSFTLHGAEPNAYVTVDSTLGEIVNADTESEIRGIQILTDATGQATINVRRAFGLGTSVITLEEVSGRGFGFATLEYVPPSERHFDMNHFNRFSMTEPSPTQTPVASPAEPNGFVGVLASDLYSPGSGFGWLIEPGSFDNGDFVGDPRAALNRDGAIDTDTNTFFAELPNDLYDVIVTMGTLQDLDGIRLKANGKTVLYAGETIAGEHLQSSFQVEVTDTLLMLEVGDSGLIPNWAINAVEIRSATQIEPIVFTTGPGVGVADETTVSSVTATTTAEAGSQVTVTTSLGTIVTPDVNPEIAGIQLTVPGGGEFSFDVLAPAHSGTARLTAITTDGHHQGTIEDSAFLSWQIAALRRFDFNHVNNGSSTVDSPTADGTIGVTRLRRSPETDGYGWVTAPNSYDSIAPHIHDQSPPEFTAVTDIAIHQDYATGSMDTGGRIFQVEVKAGVKYDVRLFTGSMYRDQSIRFQVEGGGSPLSVATTAAVYSSLTVFDAMDTDGDGLLDISVGAGGDLSDLWMANGVDIAESSVGLPATAPLLATQVVTGGAAPILTSVDLATVVDEARAAWLRTSLTQAEVARLNAVTFEIADLASPALGLAGSRAIVIDDDGAGLGWSLDGDPSTSGYDLLTVVAHELGHILGRPDLDPNLYAGDLMSGQLSPGVRYGESDGFFADSMAILDGI